MSDTANWRTQTNAEDYFGQQKKQGAVDNRRPLIRKASDLVGPGIAPYSVRITDFSDVLATYNGFFSALGNAANRPAEVDDEDTLVGYVTSDSVLGGEQVFTRLSDNAEFRRIFLRSPGASEFITWEPWRAYIPETPDPLDGVWQTPTLLNGWVHYGAPYAVPAYMRKSGVCYLKGLLKSGTVGTATPFFNLPAGFRPTPGEAGIYTGTVGGSVTGSTTPSGGSAHTHTMTNVAGRVNIGAGGDGNVSTEAPITNGWISLDGISFVIVA